MSWGASCQNMGWSCRLAQILRKNGWRKKFKKEKCVKKVWQRSLWHKLLSHHIWGVRDHVCLAGGTEAGWRFLGDTAPLAAPSASCTMASKCRGMPTTAHLCPHWRGHLVGYVVGLNFYYNKIFISQFFSLLGHFLKWFPELKSLRSTDLKYLQS